MFNTPAMQNLMQQVMQDPNLMQNMINSPYMQNVMQNISNNPDLATQVGFQRHFLFNPRF